VAIFLASCAALASGAFGEFVATFSIVGPDVEVVRSGERFVLEVRADFNAPLVACSFNLCAMGEAGAVLVRRSADPQEPNGLTYISCISQEPTFEDGLPWDLAAQGPLQEVLMDMEPADGDGISPADDVLIEAVEVVAYGQGGLTIVLDEPQAATTLGAPDGTMFDVVTVDPAASSITFQVRGILGDLDDDGDVDLLDFALFQACFTGPQVSAPEQCQSADLDRDGDVDVMDFWIFAARFTGPS